MPVFAVLTTVNLGGNTTTTGAVEAASLGSGPAKLPFYLSGWPCWPTAPTWKILRLG
ncbi:hypothetical protein [uncultured Hymenobacter sp.]|uniref:hypothetical protein n=1 Tax=uncultured Hymenobacter sp. TaxID=170016 RepID=UPI0035CC6298